MALLNPPNILPDLAFIVYRLLAAKGGGLDWPTAYSLLVPNPELFRSRSIDPATLSDQNDPLNQTVRSMADIGVFVLRPGEIVLAEPAPSALSRKGDWDYFVRVLLKRIASDATHREPRWGKDAPGALDLARSLAFVILQDPHRPLYFPGDSLRISDVVRENAIDLERVRIDHIGSGDADAQVLHNQERWQSFVKWAVALGFAERIPPARASTSQQLLLRLDPTRAVYLATREMRPGSHSAVGFLRELASLLPVVPPYGVVFQDLADHWVGDFPLGPNDVPPSLSLALLRLDAQGVLRLGHGADAPQAARLVLEYPHGNTGPIAKQVARVEIL